MMGFSFEVVCLSLFLPHLLIHSLSLCKGTVLATWGERKGSFPMLLFLPPIILEKSLTMIVCF